MLWGTRLDRNMTFDSQINGKTESLNKILKDIMELVVWILSALGRIIYFWWSFIITTIKQAFV